MPRPLTGLLIALLVFAACGQSPRQARRQVVEMGYGYDKNSFAEALKKGDADAARLFLAAGMKTDAKAQGYTVLEHAAGQPDMVRLLLEAGADPNLGDSSTPLIEAAGKAGNAAAVGLLLTAGADPNAADKTGYTPLMAAAKAGDSDLTAALLKAGADPNARSRQGHSPLGIALAAGDNALIAALEKAGARRDAVGVNLAALMQPQSLTGPAPTAYRVAFKTSAGDFVVAVDRAQAPNGADRFYHLVKNGFYDGQRFYRAVPGRLVQFGIHPTPEIAGRWVEATIPDDPVAGSNSRGSLSFAAAGLDSRSTQVFINLADNAAFDGDGFAPFGQVEEGGMEVVDALYSGYGDTPEPGRIGREGEAYLKRHFPRLDTILEARLLGVD